MSGPFREMLAVGTTGFGVGRYHSAAGLKPGVGAMCLERKVST